MIDCCSMYSYVRAFFPDATLYSRFGNGWDFVSYRARRQARSDKLGGICGLSRVENPKRHYVLYYMRNSFRPPSSRRSHRLVIGDTVFRVPPSGKSRSLQTVFETLNTHLYMLTYWGQSLYAVTNLLGELSIHLTALSFRPSSLLSPRDSRILHPNLRNRLNSTRDFTQLWHPCLMVHSSLIAICDQVSKVTLRLQTLASVNPQPT